MFEWVTNLIYNTLYPGPARNAPNEGVNIKKYIEEHHNDIKIITENDILDAKNKLNKTNIQEPPVFYTSPLLKELNNVSNIGYKQFFEQKKNKPN